MSDPTEQAGATVTLLSDRFLKVIRTETRKAKPKTGPDGQPIEPKPKRVVENHEYLLMLWRMSRGLEARAVEDPEMLTQIMALSQRFSEIVNVAVASSAERYARNPHSAASIGEIARVMGLSRQAVSQRRARGIAVMVDRVLKSGAIRFSEAKREREAIKAAQQHVEETMPEYRARHLKSVA